MNHLPRYEVLTDETVQRLVTDHHFIIPTMIMMKGLIDQKADGSNGNYDNCQNSLKKLHQAGATIIAGSDANLSNKSNNVVHGESFLTELELMTKAGMTPVEVLLSMGKVPAEHFDFLHDRGELTIGKRADLVLIEGDPTADIRACRNIKKVWVKGIEAQC